MKAVTRKLVRSLRDFEEVLSDKKDWDKNWSDLLMRGSAARRDLALHIKSWRRTNGRKFVRELVEMVSQQANYVVPSSFIPSGYGREPRI